MFPLLLEIAPKVLNILHFDVLEHYVIPILGSLIVLLTNMNISTAVTHYTYLNSFYVPVQNGHVCTVLGNERGGLEFKMQYRYGVAYKVGIVFLIYGTGEMLRLVVSLFVLRIVLWYALHFHILLFPIHIALTPNPL